MTPKTRSVGRGPAGRRYLSSEAELCVLGVCFWFRLFNVAPETTARFSYLDDRSRNQSPPFWVVAAPKGTSGRFGQSAHSRQLTGVTLRPSGLAPWWPLPPHVPRRGR
jgi:hypothetical protein